MKNEIANLMKAREVTPADLAYAYGIIKLNGKTPLRRDQYRATVDRILSEPDTAQLKSIDVIFQALGVDIYQAIEDAVKEELKHGQANQA